MITAFKDLFTKQPSNDIDLELLIGNIQSGTYQDLVLNIRASKDTEKKKSLKKKLPAFAISGTMKGRNDSDLIQHSGYICMDIDHVDPEDAKTKIKDDPYVRSAFTSCGGHGLAVIFRIKPDKHKDAFDGLCEYLLSKYGLVADLACKNVGRLRLASYDPYLINNENAKLFCKYPKKEKLPKRAYKPVFIQSDLGRVISDFKDNMGNLIDDYTTWRNIGFALASLGETGRDYYHYLSSVSDKYKQSDTDKMYSNLLKNKRGDITIATLYYFAKDVGVSLYQDDAKEIMLTARNLKRKGLTDDNQIIATMVNHGDLDESLCSEIVPQINSKTQIDGISEIEQIESEIRSIYDFRRNTISKSLELEYKGSWQPLSKKIFNSILKKVKVFKSGFSAADLDMILDSDETDDFNPIQRYLESINSSSQGHIKRLSETISSPGESEQQYKFIEKWLVSIVASAFGNHSPLMLVLCGVKQGTGKTEWFRRLLPDALKEYYAESNFDFYNNSDLATLLSENVIVMNDELDGRIMQDYNKLKAILSSQSSKVRVAYARKNEALNRLAVLCGTSNKLQVIPNDPSGNRRIIPIRVDAINHYAYNSINKEDLFGEAYRLYKNGYDLTLNQAEISLLNESDHASTSIEEDLILKYFSIPEFEEQGSYFTTTDIAVEIELHTKLRIKVNQIGSVLKAHFGLERKSFSRNNKKSKGYKLVKLDSVTDENNQTQEIKEMEIGEYPDISSGKLLF